MKQNWYAQFAKNTARFCGQPRVFACAIGVILIWIISGPLFHFSDTWQLVINTSTTIITFLMVFLIQNTQNRDMQALHIKLDELIRVTQGAHNALLDLENIDEMQLEMLSMQYQALAQRAHEQLKKGKKDTARVNV